MTGNSSTESGGLDKVSIGEALSRPNVASVMVGLAILVLLATVGNLLVCRTIRLTPRLQTPPYFLVFSLAIADFLVGLFVIPLAILYSVDFEIEGKWTFGESLCDAWVLASLWFGEASILSLCAVTWDRYVAVTTPLKYLARMRNTRTIVLIVICWMASLGSAVVTSYGLKRSENRVLCEIKGLPLGYTIYNFVVFYLLPSAGILFVNCTISAAASRHMRRVQHLEIQLNRFTGASTDSSAPLPIRQAAGLARQIKTYRTLLIVIGAYLIAWTPFSVILLLDRFLRVPGFVMYLSITLTFVNSATNPLIYSIFNNEFRRALKASLKCR